MGLSGEGLEREAELQMEVEGFREWWANEQRVPNLEKRVAELERHIWNLRNRIATIEKPKP
jgi:phage shock protein A